MSLWRIFTLLFGANILTILPLPYQIGSMRPAWVLLCLLYLQTYIPQYFYIVMGLFLGLCLDALLSTPMGEHAFALLVSTWLMVGRTHRFKFFSMIQQMLAIGLACGCYQLILLIVDASFGHRTALITVVEVAVSSMILWGLFPIILNSELKSSRKSHSV